jgi:hypothetical protein
MDTPAPTQYRVSGLNLKETAPLTGGFADDLLLLFIGGPGAYGFQGGGGAGHERGAPRYLLLPMVRKLTRIPFCKYQVPVPLSVARRRDPAT